MGIPGFLGRVLETAGRQCDLRDYAEGITTASHRKRPLRLGLDVSSWIYTAAYGYGDMLGDERHLSNYGRASLLEENASVEPSDDILKAYIETCTKDVLTRLESLRETTQADLLVVLDGTSPPIKNREVRRRRAVRQEQEVLREQPVDPLQSPSDINQIRTKANRRAGAGRYHNRIVTTLLTALRETKQPFLVAPYEADSQLAYMSDMGYIDLVVTEDSDLVAHGTKAILFKLRMNPPTGKLLKFSDLGAGEQWSLSNFTPVMITILFVAVGCDYCDKLKGVGIVTASRSIRDIFLSGSTTKLKSKLSQVFDDLYTSCYLDETTLTKEFKKEYEDQFMAAIFMYRHPVVYDPLQERNVLVSRCRSDDSPLYIDSELMDHEPYVALSQDFDKIQEIVGRLRTKEEAMIWAQGFAERMTSVTVERPIEESLPVVVTEVATGSPTMADELQEETQGELQLLATQEDVIMIDKESGESSTIIPPQPSQEFNETTSMQNQAGIDTLESDSDEFFDTQAFAPV